MQPAGRAQTGGAGGRRGGLDAARCGPDVVTAATLEQGGGEAGGRHKGDGLDGLDKGGGGGDQICSLLHQRYMDFTPCLIQGLLKAFPGKSGESDSDKNTIAMKKRSTLKLLMELYFVRIVEDVSTFTAIIKDLTSLEHLKDRETTQTNLSLLASFARQGKPFLGLQQHGEDAYDEFFMGLNITSDQKRFFKKALCTYYDAATELLQSEHASLRMMESKNAKVLNAKGELSDENTAAYEKLRKSFDQLLRCISSLAEALDMQPPVMLEDGHTTRVTTGIGLTPSEKDSSAAQPICDDEDTKGLFGWAFFGLKAVVAVAVSFKVAENKLCCLVRLSAESRWLFGKSLKYPWMLFLCV